MTEQARYVRLKPLDPASGYVVKTYTHRLGSNFVKFSEPGVWHKVSPELADQLKLVRQIPEKKNSPFVFDVCDESEARRLDQVAKQEREQVKAKVEPTVDTAKDLSDYGPGRGDLSIDEVTSTRMSALAEAATRASGSQPSPFMANIESPEPLEGAPKPVTPKRRGRPRKKPTAETESE